MLKQHCDPSSVRMTSLPWPSPGSLLFMTAYPFFHSRPSPELHLQPAVSNGNGNHFSF